VRPIYALNPACQVSSPAAKHHVRFRPLSIQSHQACNSSPAVSIPEDIDRSPYTEPVWPQLSSNQHRILSSIT
jgi:hypothetical protein